MINFKRIAAKTIVSAMLYYHAFAVDINRALYITGLRTDEKAEEIGKKHAMAVYDIFVKICGKDKVDEFLKNN